MHRDARQPGGEGGAPSKLVKVLIGAHIGILHYIFGLSVIVQDSARHPVEPLVVAPHDDLVQGGVTSFHAIDDLLVGAGFEPRSFHSSNGCHGSTNDRAVKVKKVTSFPRVLCRRAFDRQD
jgi:hypothetical protein